MSLIRRSINKIKKNKLFRYFVVGGFFFFFIKGLVWLIIIFFAFFGLNNFF